MIRILLVLASFMALFMFPWPLTALLVAAAAMTLPAAAFAFGLLFDIVYAPGGYWPVASLVGLAGTGLALLVRRFVKTRIMGA